jgi:hypothetical protein
MDGKQRPLRTPIPLPSNIAYDIPATTQLLPHNRRSPAPAPAPVSTLEAPSRARVSPPPTQLLHHNRTSPAPAPTRKARPRARVAPPLAQLAKKANPRKRKLPEKEPQTQRLTRAQAKRSQAHEAEEQKLPGAGSTTLFPPTQLVEPALPSRKKQKTAHVQDSDQLTANSSTATQVTHRAPTNLKRSVSPGPGKNVAMEPTQLVTRSPAKSKIPKAIKSPVKKRTLLPVRPDAASPQKQKSLIVILRGPQKATGIERSENDDMQRTAADRVKVSPRKAAVAPLSRFKPIPNPLSARNTTGRAKPAIGTSGSSKRLIAAGTKPNPSEFDDF